MVLKQLGAGPELVHCHATLTLGAFMTSALTSMGVGEAGAVSVTNYSKLDEMLCNMYIPLAGRNIIPGSLLLVSFTLPMA